jgi:hypothetical protein
MDKEEQVIPGNDYEVCRTVSFERHGSMDEQRKDLSEVLRRRRVQGR